jgi:hypothetical protein
MSSNILRASLIVAVLGKIAGALTYLDDSMGEGWDVESVPYSQFSAEVKTGDLLLTSSTSVYSINRMMSNSLWSHVGMAYRGDDGIIYEWSAHNSVEDIDNSKGINWGGPQLVPLDHLVAESGTVFWRPVVLTEDQRSHIGMLVDKFAYKLPFSNYAEFLSYLGWPFSKFFAGYGGGMACPHIVALTYVSIGAIRLDRDISLYTPESLSDTGDAKWNAPVGITSMVVGFDATRLVRLPVTSKK